ncbi:MAG: SseB family protein [Rhodobacteraceae bacterium]|nr:SseB family protein [Paracoccaceae bacterium]
MVEQTELNTDLDRARLAMTQGGDAARLRFYERLADSHLIVALEREPIGDNISPELFETGDGRFVLVFDREERLVQFTGKVTPYAGLTGRVLMQMLGGQGIGLALNPEVAESSILIPAQAIDWLNKTLAQAPDRVTARVIACSPPLDMSAALYRAIAAKLANAPGLADAAWLVEASYDDGGKGRLLGFVGAHPGAEAALAKATAEALIFAGAESGAESKEDSGGLDVGFFAPTDPLVSDMVRVGRKIEIPKAPAKNPEKRAAPGSDPDKPPILR